MESHQPKSHLKHLLQLEARSALSRISPAQEIKLDALRHAFDGIVAVKELRANRDLANSLNEVEAFARPLRNPPFSGDLGVGNSPAMEVRFNAAGRFRRDAASLLEFSEEIYMKLIGAFISDDVREATDHVHPQPLDDVLRRRFPEFYELQSLRKGRPAFWVWLQRRLRSDGHQPEQLKPTDRLVEELGYDMLETFDVSLALNRALNREADDEAACDLVELPLGELARFVLTNLPPGKK